MCVGLDPVGAGRCQPAPSRTFSGEASRLCRSSVGALQFGWVEAERERDMDRLADARPPSAGLAPMGSAPSLAEDVAPWRPPAQDSESRPSDAGGARRPDGCPSRPLPCGRRGLLAVSRRSVAVPCGCSPFQALDVGCPPGTRRRRRLRRPGHGWAGRRGPGTVGGAAPTGRTCWPPEVTRPEEAAEEYNEKERKGESHDLGLDGAMTWFLDMVLFEGRDVGLGRRLVFG